MNERPRAAHDCEQHRCPTDTRTVVARCDEVPVDCPHRVPRERAEFELNRTLGRDLRVTAAAALVLSPAPRGSALVTLRERLRDSTLVLLEPVPHRTIFSGHREDPTPEEPPAPVPPDEPKQSAWIRFRVVDDASEEPVPGVRLVVRLPDGAERTVATGPDGSVEIEPTEPGACDMLAVLNEPPLEIVRIQ